MSAPSRGSGKGRKGIGAGATVMVRCANPNTGERIGMSDTRRDEQARLDALHRYAILDTPPEQAFDHIVNLTAQLLRMPAAAISFIDRDRQWFKAKVGI